MTKPEIKVTFGGVVRSAAPAPPPPPPPPWGWGLYAHSDQEVKQLHLIPHWDIACHDVMGCCPCGTRPEEEAGMTLIHHVAFDGREDYEQGRRKHH